MIAVDTNILVYAHNEGSPRKHAAEALLRSLAGSSSRWAIPVFCIGEFLRVVTHPRSLDPPLSADVACGVLTVLLALPGAVVLYPGPAFPELLMETVRGADARRNMVFDAQIAALCREHGVARLVTEDRDFRRFRGLEIERLGG